jgi:hypothetical protein
MGAGLAVFRHTQDAEHGFLRQQAG